MIGWIAMRLVGAGVSDRWARLVAWVLVLAAIAAVVALAIGGRDRRMIEAHDARQNAKVLGDQLEQGQKADAVELEQRGVDQVQHDQLQGAIDNATSAQPDAARGGVGPATSAALDELRRRQDRQRRQ